MVQEDVILGGSLWEQIQFINHHHPLSSSQQSDKKQQWSMVTIRESLHKQNNFSVFPPVNHENLHISSHQNHEQHQNSSSSLDSSPPPPPPSDFNTRCSPPSSSKDVSVSIGWFDFGLEFLRTKIYTLLSLFGYNGSIGRAFRSIGPAVTMAVLVIWWWLCRRIRLRRNPRESVEYLKLIIKEKDEKIVRLLHQIAQMNEVLVARHKVSGN